MMKSIGLHPLPFPAPVWVIGTYDKNGRADMMTAAWAGVCCSDPFCVSVSVRPSRYTYENIVQGEAFTVNLPSADFVREADYFGLVSGRDQDKVDRAGLKAEKGKFVNAPVIAGFSLVMECSLMKKVDIGSHVEFIGEVLDTRVDEKLLDSDGAVEPGRAGFFVLFNGYRGIGDLVGEPYSAGKELA